MYELDERYIKQLEELAAEIQSSEELSQYLEEEEEELYNRFKDQFEPRISQIYLEVAEQYPLQLIHLEQILLDENFEGLFLPKTLGYSVLRGEVNQDYKYVRPQNHFKDILLAIAQSANFDQLRKRIGQSIQVGFALSSDIWVTNLINEVVNKKVRYYLQGMKVERFRFLEERQKGFNNYARQFRKENFLTAEFPAEEEQLPIFYSQLKHFLFYRIGKDFPNQSLLQPLYEMCTNPAFENTPQQLEMCILSAAFMDGGGDDARQEVGKVISQSRKSFEDFEDAFFQFLMELYQSKVIDYKPEAELWLSELIDKEPKDDISGYFLMTDLLHEQGYESEEVQEKIKGFYNLHAGLSLVNDAVRQSVLKYFTRALDALKEEDYPKFFELVRYYPIYMQIFGNQQFNQSLKDASLAYVKRLQKRYTDKRGKDYQDIKKFVTTNFTDLNFLTEKEVVELFKTRRKKKVVE